MMVYLHGFRSSPNSFKAQLMQAHFQQLGRSEEYVCPQLPASPKMAMQMIENIASVYAKDELVFVGSSLGGFYATYIAEKLGSKAFLINPASYASRDLSGYVGVTTAYHSNVVFEFKAEYVEELRALAVNKITKSERYFLLAATGDEVLDWREMVAHYVGAKHIVIQGSDHGVSEFEDYIATVMEFYNARPA
jgi:predicted esterase YcpF (UPF0227 family)